MKVAYVRVSTIEQNEERQVVALKKHGIEKWFTEKVSGKDTNRVKLQEMIEFVRDGDLVYVHDFSRLARSTKDLLKIIELLESKNVKLISNKENFDTSTHLGKMMITMIAAVNQFERDNLLERQREGIALAKVKGKYAGRKKIERPSNWDETIKLYNSRKITARTAMKMLHLKVNTFYNFLNESKQNSEKAVFKND